MEGLLILIGIWVLDVVIKKVAANRKKQQQLPPQQYQPEDENDGYDYQEQEAKPPRSLQDLIRQFEESQQQAAQGNIEPPTPPVKRHRTSGELTLRDVAEAVIDAQVDFVDLEFFMDCFDVDENTAAEMLMALQHHHIVGHDMGEGYCDVLVHDMEELDNLLNHEPHQEKAEEDRSQAQEESEVDTARQQELERQRKLNELEDRARAAREAAGGILETAEEETPARRGPQVSVKDKEAVRKGFIWAKVLDEPRFKRRWSTQYR